MAATHLPRSNGVSVVLRRIFDAFWAWEKNCLAYCSRFATVTHHTPRDSARGRRAKWRWRARYPRRNVSQLRGEGPHLHGPKRVPGLPYVHLIDWLDCLSPPDQQTVDNPPPPNPNPPPLWTGPDGTCGPRDTFPVYRVTAYGSLWLPGPGSPYPNVTRTPAVLKEMNDKMMAEIYTRGPIVCQMVCPDAEPEKGFPNGYVDDYAPFYPSNGSRACKLSLT